MKLSLSNVIGIVQKAGVTVSLDQYSYLQTHWAEIEAALAQQAQPRCECGLGAHVHYAACPESAIDRTVAVPQPEPKCSAYDPNHIGCNGPKPEHTCEFGWNGKGERVCGHCDKPEPEDALAVAVEKIRERMWNDIATYKIDARPEELAKVKAYERALAAALRAVSQLAPLQRWSYNRDDDRFEHNPTGSFVRWADIRAVSQPLTDEMIEAHGHTVAAGESFENGRFREAFRYGAKWARGFAVSQPTREQIVQRMKDARSCYYGQESDWPKLGDVQIAEMADAVVALYGKSEAKSAEAVAAEFEKAHPQEYAAALARAWPAPCKCGEWRFERNEQFPHGHSWSVCSPALK